MKHFALFTFPLLFTLALAFGCPEVGSDCEVNDDCGPGEFCLLDGCEGFGVCQTKPSTCEPANAPFCGCNEKDYDNICEAQKDGQSVKGSGTCEENA
jgi:hypothetical protein